MKYLYFYFLLLLFALSGCNDKNTNPGDEFPPGYQHDIPWPSLADSPWPMYRGNPQGNSRSKYIGPQLGIVEWERDSLMLTSGLSIGYKDVIYTISENPFLGIVAINNKGKFLWKYDSLDYRIMDLHTTPIILKDSTLISTSGQWGEVLALKPNGTLKWRLNIGHALYNVGIVVGLDGTIYLTDKTNTLYAISKDGIILWSFQDSRIGHFGFVALTLSPDSKTIYIQGKDVSLVAFDLDNKSIKWIFGNLTMPSYPIIDCKGNIYLLTLNSELNNKHSLYSLKPDGTVRWIFEHNNRNLTENENGIAMDYEGNIYFAYDSLYSVNYEGKLNWKMSLKYLNLAPLVIDAIGTVYIQRSGDGLNQLPLAVTKEGKILWEITSPLNSFSGRCGALDSDGKWYLSFYKYGDAKVYSIK
jgi:outer membrane protein assembly factor BamB